jgi:hypothetical protein
LPVTTYAPSHRGVKRNFFIKMSKSVYDIRSDVAPAPFQFLPNDAEE